MGVLTYRLTKADAKPTPATAVDGERIIDVETWVAKPASPKYNPKMKATYRIRAGKVTGAPGSK